MLDRVLIYGSQDAMLILNASHGAGRWCSRMGTAPITGVTAGIGYAFATALAARGECQDNRR